MKRRLSLLLVALLLLTAIPGVAHADMGPKPSIDIKFSGLEGETYYVCILAEDKELLSPFEMPSLKRAIADGYESRAPETVLQLILDYQDKDGLVPMYDITDCSKTHYFSPIQFQQTKFKILIYFPKTDHFVVSDRIYTKYAFNSYYRIDAKRCGLTPDTSGELNLGMLSGFGYFKQFISFYIRLSITLAIELAIAWSFHLREKRVLRLIVIVNIITQTLLTLTLSLIDFFNGSLSSLIIYVLLETGVFLIEGIIYSVRVNEISVKQFKTGELWGVAWLSNTASFLVGVFLLALPLDLIF